MPGFEWLGKEEREAVLDVMDRGVLFRYEFADQRQGAFRVKEFEEAFAKYTGAGFALAVSSGSAALKVALAAMGIGPGDEVVTQGFTFVATWEAIFEAGATPVFCEIDETLCMDPADLKKKITDKTRCIIPVHMMGAQARIKEIMAIADEHGIPVLEDTAQSAGGSLEGKALGTFGQTGTFSFDSVKTLTTGEGGMICTDDEHLAARLRRLKFHGLGVDAFDRQVQGRAPQAEVIEPGYKYNLPDILAAIGIGQIERLETMNARRAMLAAYYLEKMKAIPEIRPLAIPDHPLKHAWHLFIVRLVTDRTDMDRDRFTADLKERNIGTGLHFRAAHLQKFYRETFPEIVGSLPNTEWNSQRVCSLPLFPDMTRSDVDDVIDAIREVLA